ncbi:hypothetical protein VNI00_013935 [Paramarasmius palmivorus]|uniref:Uncharacterized protein n=1 Tax=Paramarasmius palmivorus TaxID=297713 RepID=A0AAW0BVT6_9AGAR
MKSSINSFLLNLFLFAAATVYAAPTPYQVDSVNSGWVIVDPCNNGWHVGQVPERRGENAVDACNNGWSARAAGVAARTADAPSNTPV